MQNVTDDFRAKSRGPENRQTCYIHIIEDDIDIFPHTDLVSLTFSDFCFDGGNFIGTTINKKIEFILINEGIYNIENKEVTLFLGEEDEEFINCGNYIIERPTNDEVKIKSSYIAFDYMRKFDIPFVDDYDYSVPITLFEFSKRVCNFVGVGLGNIQLPANNDFIINEKPFFDNMTCRQVIMRIAEMSGTFAKIGRDNLLYFKTFEETDEVIYKQHYKTIKPNNQFGPINTVILRLGGVEGENVTRQDEESVEKYGQIEMSIIDNPFIFNQALRTQAISELFNILNGIKYIPIELKYYGFSYLDSGDLIKVEDTSGEILSTVLLNHIFKFRGMSEISSPALTKTETRFLNTNNVMSALRRTEIIVDKQNQTITSVVERTTALDSQVQQNTQSIINNSTTIVQTATNITTNIQETGGNNRIRDSAFFKDDGTVWIDTNVIHQVIQTTEVEQNTESGSELLLQNGTREQEFVLIVGNNYTITFRYKKQSLIPDRISYVRLYTSSTNYIEVLSTTAEHLSREEVSFSFTATVSNYRISLYTNNDDFYISDLRVNEGDRQPWSQFFDELYGKGHTLDKTGLELKDLGGSNVKTKITNDSITIRNGNTIRGELSDEMMYAQQSKVETRMQIGSLGFIRLDDNNYIIAKG